MKKYQQLTLEQRYQISAFKQAGFGNSAIAEEIGVDKYFIGRELKRNRSKRGYRPKRAHAFALARRRGKVKPRISRKTWREVERDLRRPWNPEQIAGRRPLEDKPKVSHERIYQHTARDKHAGGVLYLNLRRQKRRRKRCGSYSQSGQWQNLKRINELPPRQIKRGDSAIGKLTLSLAKVTAWRLSRWLTAARNSSGYGACGIKPARKFRLPLTARCAV